MRWLITLLLCLLPWQAPARTLSEDGLLRLSILLGRDSNGTAFAFADYTTGVGEEPIRIVAKRNLLGVLTGPQKAQLVACYQTVSDAIKTAEQIP